MFMLKWHHTADRGFAYDHLMKRLTRLGWHWRMMTAMLGLLLMGSASIHTAPTQELQQVLAPTGTLPAQYFGYVMSQVSSTILVVDTSTNEIVNKLKHADMVKPAGGRFHPSLKRYYAGGTGKVTIWDTTDVANPVYLKTVIPAPGSTGEYRGFLIYRGSTTALDGNVWMANIQDSKVYVYRAADLEGTNPTPVKVFDATTDGISFPHFMMGRPGTHEVWLTNRPVNANGYLLRFNGETHTVITTPTAKLETTSTTGDEPNEFSFSKDGLLAYVGHHGAILTGSPANQLHVALVDAATFTVKKLIPMIASATVPGYVDIDPDGGRVYVTTKWSPTLVVFDINTERVLRYIEIGGFGPGYGVALTPDKKRLYIPLGVPAQSAVAVVDAKTLTIVANIVDTDLNGPRAVRFTHY
jgi:DNA-binding beta-propeller fold protein YncE